MSIDLQTVANGDTDYVSKIGNNFATIEAAINGLIATNGGNSDAISIQTYLDSLFNSTTTLIGINSYKPTASGSNLTVNFGGAYLSSSRGVVQSIAPVTLSFSGAPAGTYYITPDAAGLPSRGTSLSQDSVYSVFWTGASFNSITRIVRTLFDAQEEDDSRLSAANSPPVAYATLDARLEAIETTALGAAASAALALGRWRKIGITIDPNTGIKGLIQIDFAGTIIGWSCIADQACSLTVEVDVKAGSAPPVAPSVPNTTTDKISASAPITMSSAQSAAAAAAGVASWTTALTKWSTVQFNLTASSSFRWATLYLLVLQS